MSQEHGQQARQGDDPGAVGDVHRAGGGHRVPVDDWSGAEDAPAAGGGGLVFISLLFEIFMEYKIVFEKNIFSIIFFLFKIFMEYKKKIDLKRKSFIIYYSLAIYASFIWNV